MNVPVPAHHPDAPALPPGYRARAELAHGPGRRVVHAVDRAGREVVLRLVRGGGDETLAELGVLIGVEHPALARLTDLGVLAGGGRFVAREFVDGVELGTWAQDRAAGELGPVLVALCEGLDHLHGRGFVHGDLKAQNVLVRADGSPVLVDFGLAGRRGVGAGTASGTPVSVAPERLLGAPLEPAADLFALGAMLVELLLGRPDAGRFYADFPRLPFLAAAGQDGSALPVWARDLVERLTAREPGERPASAALVARAIAARLALPAPRFGGALELAPPPDLGREDLVASALDGLRSDGAPALWLALDAATDAEPLARHLTARAVLEGLAADLVQVEAELSGARDAAALDRRVLDRLERSNAVLVASVSSDDAWALRAARVLARAARQRARAAVVVGPPPGDLDDLEVLTVPAPSAGVLRAFLGARGLEGDGPALDVLAEELAQDARGSVAAVAQRLTELAHAGAFLVAGERIRLVASEPREPHRRAVDPAGTSPGGTRALLALALLEVSGPVDVAAVGSVLGLDEPEAARLVGELVSAGTVRRSAAARHRVAVDVRPLLRGAAASPAREVLALAAASGTSDTALLARALSDGLPPEELVDELVERVDRGEPERTLALIAGLRRWSELSAPLAEPAVAALEALATAALGQVDRAESELARAATDDAAAGVRAVAERVRGRIAQGRRRTEQALAHFDRAAELDPRLRPEAEVARLHHLHELGRFDEVLGRVAALSEEGLLEPGRWPARESANVRSLAALARFGLGEGEQAVSALQGLAASTAPDGPVHAAVLLNLATVERRVHGPARARPHLERAVTLLEADGRLASAAQARTALGGVLRELGALVQAERELEAAVAVRERLEGSVGAALARGTLGLLLAERGHLRRSLSELGSAARDLVGAAGRRHGPLVRARVDELRARLALPPDDAEAPEAVIDPRELLYRGRAALLRGDCDGGLALLRRARDLAERLGQAPVASEAAAALDLLDGRAPLGDGAEARVARVLLDGGAVERAEALDLALALEAAGRDGCAARLAIARARWGGPRRAEAVELARRSLARCEAGLSPAEAAAARRALLGLPDPRPADLDAWSDAETFDEDDDVELLSLLAINQRLVAQEDQRALLGEIVEHALAVTGAERGFLVLEVDGELEIDTAIDSARGDVPRPQIEVSSSILRAALAQGEVVRLSNASEDPTLRSAPSVAQLDLRSVLCAPFDVGDGTRGAIYVDHRVHAGAFAPRTERLLGLLAGQAALAIRQLRRVAEIRALNARLEERVQQQQTDLETARRSLRAIGMPAPAGGLVGDSPAMQRVRALLERVAASDVSVAVHGPSGSGKELAARALHDLSERRSGPFVTENCASLPESLIESELFGYTKGAFTGADRNREGLFERAHGGTLFLDEIGEMPRELQSKLLRVLETREVRRLGDDRPRPVDVRLVTATNRDLEAEVRSGRFREDLYYRVCGIRVRMPALDERIEDLPLLVRHFLDVEERKDGVRRRVSREVMARLARRTWPGNVRELRNEVVRLCVLSQGDVDDPDLVSNPGPTARRLDDPVLGSDLMSMDEIERRAILGTLDLVGGDKRKAAQVLGISLSKLYERLKRYRDESGDADPLG